MSAALREYISIKPPGGSSPLVKSMRPLIVSQNRLGGAVTYFGEIVHDLKEIMQVQADSSQAFLEKEKELVEKEHEHKLDIIKPLSDQEEVLEEGKEQDKQAEKDQEGDEEEQGEELGKKLAKQDKEKKGVLEKFLQGVSNLLSPFVRIFGAMVAYKIFDFISDEENIEKVKTVLKAIGAIGRFALKLGEFGVTNVMEGIGRVFGDNPDKEGMGKVYDKMFGVLQIIGGLASFYLLSRTLMPWKLISDVAFMTSLGRTAAVANAMGCGPNNKRFRKNKFNKQMQGDSGKRLRKRYQRRYGPEAAKNKFKNKVRNNRFANFKKDAKNFIKNSKKTLTNVKNVAVSKGKSLIKSTIAFGNRVEAGIGNFFGSVRKKVGGAFTGVKNFAKDKFTSAIKTAKKWGKGAWNWGANQAKNIKGLAELVNNPKKLGEVVMKKVKEGLMPTLKKNKYIKQVMKLSNPKTALKSAKNIAKSAVKGAFTNPGFTSFRDFLKAAKANVKIGGIDIAIAAIMGLLDYAMGESPINALVKATGGLLGYSAGFAIGSPFGGVPGFITGALGGVAGDFLANKLLEGLAKTPGIKDVLANEDPLANMLGMKKRPLLRDPSIQMDFAYDLENSSSTEDEENGDLVMETGPFTKGDLERKIKFTQDRIEKLRNGEIPDKNGRKLDFNERKLQILTENLNKLEQKSEGGIVKPNPNVEVGQSIDGKEKDGNVFTRSFNGLMEGVKNFGDMLVKPKDKVVKDEEEKTDDVKVTAKQPPSFKDVFAELGGPEYLSTLIKDTIDPVQTDAINTKTEQLKTISEDKVRRDKENLTETQIMVMRQQIKIGVPIETEVTIDITPETDAMIV